MPPDLPSLNASIRTLDPLHPRAQAIAIAGNRIGEKANRRILDLYHPAAQTNGPRGRRFRIEHAQHLGHGDFPSFAAENVIASMQPYHAADDEQWCEMRLGRERAQGAYMFRSLLDAGATLGFGSDLILKGFRRSAQGCEAQATLGPDRPEGHLP